MNIRRRLVFGRCGLRHALHARTANMSVNVTLNLWATSYQSKERCFPSATGTDEKDGGQCGEAGSLEDEFVEEEGN